MNRTLLRNLTGLALAAAALGALGGTAAGIGTDGDAPACRTWHPALAATVTHHAWNPAPADQPGWPAAVAAQTTWHRAAGAVTSWHPEPPATGGRHAWHPTPDAPAACTSSGA